ncbi:MAG TPA: hypothetical protein VHO69_03845, partial [Phototrophicaceae bacterium]|nr:hypothetical protein [Phototrophicaceae bacterium]
MPQSRLTPQLLLGILIRIPEGFIPKSKLAERYRVNSKAMKQLTQAVASGLFGYTNNVFYDTVRLTADQMLQLKPWCRPQMPRLRPDETFMDAPILEQIGAREQQQSAAGRLLISRLQPVGYADKQQVYAVPEEAALLENLLGSGVLKQIRYLVYDPLRLGAASVEEVLHQRDLVPLREQLIEFLKTQKGMVATRPLLDEQYG